MQRNDISVDSSALSGAMGNIRYKIQSLYSASDIMSRNLAIAAREFNSSNFAQAAEIVGNTQARLSQAIDCVERLRKYIAGLESCISDYLSCKY